MKKIKKGDIVARKSYGKDIIFYVKRIIKTSSKSIAILCGLYERIEADSNIDDLELLNNIQLKDITKNKENKLNTRIDKKIKEYRFNFLEDNQQLRQKIITGKILHLDGDKRYSQKSYNYYKKMGLNAIVKNIPEYKQPRVVYKLHKI